MNASMVIHSNMSVSKPKNSPTVGKKTDMWVSINAIALSAMPVNDINTALSKILFPKIEKFS